MLNELQKFYSHDNAFCIYCIAILYVCNTVCKFLNDLGKSCFRITSFMCARMVAAGVEHHLLVADILKLNESRINLFFDFSWKARLKGAEIFLFFMLLARKWLNQCASNVIRETYWRKKNKSCNVEE